LLHEGSTSGMNIRRVMERGIGDSAIENREIYLTP
jgi:hypothetical protein